MSAQRNFDEVEIVTYSLTDQIYMLQGAGGKIGVLIGEEGILMIDNQFAPLSEKIISAVRELSSAPINYLINTHWHGDHTGGNENFTRYGTLIIAHENVRQRMIADSSARAALPKMTFNDKTYWHLNDENVEVIHLHDAHTDGDAVIWFSQSNVIHTGDIFFHQRFPYIDLDSGGSVEGLIRAVSTVLLLCNESTQIIPGHGPLASTEDFRHYLSFLTEMKKRINAEITAGKSLEELNIDGLVAGYEEWSWNFINSGRIVEIFYNSLVQD